MAYNQPFAIDTNTFSLLLRGHNAVTRAVSTTELVAVPIITIAELRAGFLHGRKSPKYEPVLDDFLSDPSTTILHINNHTVPIYAELYAHSRSQGKQLSPNDLWIGALCIQYSYPLLTFDKDFDALPQIRRVRLQQADDTQQVLH